MPPPIAFAPTFFEVLYRVLQLCVARAALPRTYRRDQVESWVRHRLARRPA